MKKIEIIIRPMKLEAVKAALSEEAGVVGMTVSDVRGLSRAEDGARFPGAGSDGALALKVKIEIVVADEEVQQVIDLVQTYARTGASGDGKIFVLDMEDALRIRTGDRGNAAVS